MSNNIETAVLIVGAGPVGLTLALDLAWRGIEVAVVEIRGHGVPPPAKCNHVSARTMEVYRRLGISQKIRDAGLPADYPNDVAFRTTFTGIEIARIPIPCRRDRYTTTEGPDTGWPTPEPPHRINQIYLEPILFEQAAATAEISIHCRSRFIALEQSDHGAVAVIEDLETGNTHHFFCEYLIGCDGGSSTVRKSIGSQFHGDSVLQRCQSSFIRAAELIHLQNEKPAWSTISLNPRRSGNVYAIDGQSLWIVHNYLREDETDFESVDRDSSIRTILGVDDEFKYDILAREDWFGRRLVADRFRKNRVFLCGDAAHIWVPYAGYGMNAGVADAANLSWLLSATLNQWAPESLLDAYERERLPITEQVSHFVMNHAHAMARQRRSVPGNIEAVGQDGDRVRELTGRDAYKLNVQQYCAAGLNFGYFYDDSPIIAHEPEPPPAYTMSTFTASTLPGCRLPHLYLESGHSLYDLLGPEFTLLRLDPDLDVTVLTAAATHRCCPLHILDVTIPPDNSEYTHPLILVRPDQHVAWRGHNCPIDGLSLIDQIRGCTPA